MADHGPAALRDDVYAVHAQLTAQVLRSTDADDSAPARIAEWEEGDSLVVARAAATLEDICSDETGDLARVSVGLRVVRGLWPRPEPGHSTRTPTFANITLTWASDFPHVGGASYRRPSDATIFFRGLGRRPTDHPPASVKSLWRLRGLRPHLLALAIMLGTALGGIALDRHPAGHLALIDGPITNGEIEGVLPLGLLALALGVLEAVLIFWRRWESNAVCFDGDGDAARPVRADRRSSPWLSTASGSPASLLSRVTMDLSAIRRFAGFGLLFLIINVLQVTAVTAVLLHMYWPSGWSWPSPPVRSCGSRCASRRATSRCRGGSRTSRATWPPAPRRAPSASA